MKKYIPCMYKNTIFDIDFKKLKEKNIKCLVFDLDNTLMLKNESIPNKKIVSLIKSLKKDFNIYILSNNSSKKRVSSVAKYLEVRYINFALKPFSFGFKKIMKETSYRCNDICIIGDQILTDVLGGNRLNIFTVLLEPLGKEELKITSLNRFIEKRKVKKLERLNLFKRGEFYG